MGDKELQEARNCVKEANLFEENMTAQEIKQTYRMIQMSKKSKEEDEQKRSSDPFNFEVESDSETIEQNIHALAEELCSPSTLRLQKKEVTEASEQNNKEDNKLNGLGKSDLLDATKVKFGYLDMPPMSKCDLQLIHHQSNFVVLQHTEEYCNANHATKAKMLSWHWSKISNAKARQTMLSSTQKKCGSKFYSMFIATTTDEEINDAIRDTYISRSGRLTKRKCYADSDEDSTDVNTTPKKSRTNDRGWISNNNNNDNQNNESKGKSAIKKSKLTPTKDIEHDSKSENDSKKLDYTPVLTPLKEDDIQDEELMDTGNQDCLEDVFDRNEGKSKKLSSAEIMKRSSLFGGPIIKKKRSEEMLSKSIEEQARKKKEEKIMEKFEKSIDSTIEDDEPEPVSPINEVKVLHPRRVIPPVPRKGIGSRASKIAAAIAASNQAKINNTSQDPEVSSSSRTTTRRRNASTKDDDKIEVTPSTSNVDTSDFAECPICQKSFHVETIQTHASTCGDDVSSSPTTTRAKRMQCEICGGRFPFGDRYNLHVTDCLRAKQEEDEKSQQLISKYKKQKN